MTNIILRNFQNTNLMISPTKTPPGKSIIDYQQKKKKKKKKKEKGKRKKKIKKFLQAFTRDISSISLSCVITEHELTTPLLIKSY